MSTDALDTSDVAAETAATAPAARAQRRIQLQEAALPVVVVALLVAGTIADREQFLTRDNLLTVLTQASVTGVVAMGMTFVIATGGIDLSVGSVLAAAAVAGGLAGEEQSLPFMLGAIGFALLLGLVNGVAIAYGRIVPFIATLAMFAGARGLALWMSDKTPISLLELDFVREVGRGRVGGIPYAGHRLRGRHRGRLGPAQPHPLRPPRHRRRGQPRGRPHGRRPPAAHRRQRLRAVGAVRGHRGRAALRAPGERVTGGREPAGAGRHRRRGHRRDQPRRGRATIVGTFLGVITFGLLFNLLNLLDMPTELQQLSKGVIILAAAALQRRDR